LWFIANSRGDNLNGDKVMDVTKLAAVRIAVVRFAVIISPKYISCTTKRSRSVSDLRVYRSLALNAVAK